MSVSDVPTQPGEADHPSDARVLFKVAYRCFAYFGAMSLTAALLWGFRYDAEASWFNVPLDMLLYAAYIAPHLLLTRAEVKESVWGRMAGTLRERQIYVTLAVVGWLVVFWLHWPVPGGMINVPDAVRFVGYVGFLWTVLLFYDGMTLETMDGMLGIPGSRLQYSHGAEAPLQTLGQYAQVRHPKYRATLLMGVAALVVHPHAGQLLWTLMLGATFVSFIPVEEAELRASRGEEYERYCQQTPYRLFRGIW